MISAMYRTHKTLQSPQKVSSLYAFDALARSAKTQVSKGKLSPSSQPGKPNAASFLLKLEGVLEGLFKDLAYTTDFPEMKVGNCSQVSYHPLGWTLVSASSALA